jgi:hypothetical protein
MVCLGNTCISINTLRKGDDDDDDNDDDNNNNTIYLTANGLSPGGCGYKACT